MMKSLGIAFVLAACALSAPARAQTPDEIELTRAAIQKDRQAIHAEALDLSEEESLAFWPLYRDYRVEMARLGDRLVRVITEFASSQAVLTDEQAVRLTDEYLDIRAKEVAVRQKHVKLFRKSLPPVKVARFVQIENKLDAVIQYELGQTIPLAR